MSSATSQQGDENQNHNGLSPRSEWLLSKTQQQQIPERIQRKEKRPCTVLVGRQNSTAIMENRIEFPQILKMDPPYNPAIPLLSLYLKKMKSAYGKKYLHSCVHCSTIPSSQDKDPT